MAALSEKDLNELFTAALEFGVNWRRPVSDLAADHFPDYSDEQVDLLVAAVEEARSSIEAYVVSTHISLAGQWTRAETMRTDAWAKARFSWISPENRRRALSQGRYYAWHDHG